MSDSITILSSDNEIQVVEDSPQAERKKIMVSPKIKKIVPLISVTNDKHVFAQLLDKCKSIDPSSDMELAIKKMWKRFNSAIEQYTNSLVFKELVEKAMVNIEKEPYSQLKLIGDELNYNKKPNMTSECSSQSVENEVAEIDPITANHIKKLEKTLQILHKKIQWLDNDEIDLSSSDEENSAYVQVSRYKERICQIFKKLCELQKKDYTIEKPLQKRIKFSGTEIPAVNKAIEKFYNDRKEFPDYRDILGVVQKANEVKNLNLSSAQVEIIAKKAFLNFGELLKKLRSYDDYEIFLMNSTNEEDPATHDPNLRVKLEENKRKYGSRIDEVIDKYALKQSEENLEPQDVNSDLPEESSDEDVESDHSRDSIMEVKSDSEDDLVIVTSLPKPIDIKIVVTDVKYLPEWKRYVDIPPQPSTSRIESPELSASRSKSPQPSTSRSKSPLPSTSRIKSPQPSTSRSRSPQSYTNNCYSDRSPQPSTSRRRSSDDLSEPSLKRRKVDFSDSDQDSDGNAIPIESDDIPSSSNSKIIDAEKSSPIKDKIETETEDVIDICSDSCDRNNDVDEVEREEIGDSILEPQVVIEEPEPEQKKPEVTITPTNEVQQSKDEIDDIIVIDEVANDKSPLKIMSIPQPKSNAINLSKVIRRMKFDERMKPKHSIQKIEVPTTSTSQTIRNNDPRRALLMNINIPGTSRQLVPVNTNNPKIKSNVILSVVNEGFVNLSGKIGNFFGFKCNNQGAVTDRNIVYCLACEKQFSYSGNTYHLRNHLKTVHRGLSVSLNSPISKIKENELHHLLYEWIIKNNRPLSMLEDEGFTKVLQCALNTKQYQPPTKEVMKKYVENEFAKEMHKIVGNLANVKWVALTAASWTSVTNKCYVDVTAHYISEHWQYENKLIGVRKIKEKNLVESCYSMFSQIIDEYVLKDKVDYIVTDFKLMSGNWETKNFNCAAHTLQLVIYESMQTSQINYLLKKCRRLVKYIDSNSVLKLTLISQGFNEIKLDIKTRWSSTISMLHSFLENRNYFQKNAHLLGSVMLTEPEWTTLKSVIDVLELSKKVAQLLGGNGFATMSVVWPLFIQLLLQMASTSSDSHCIKTFKNTFCQNLKSHLNNWKHRDDYLESSALDPRFKNLPWLTEAEKNRIWENLVSNYELRAKTEIQDSQKKERTCFFGWNNDKTVSLKDEISMFKIAKFVVDDDCCPILWWKSASSQYPILSILAKQKLCVPATSIACDHLFDKTGLVVMSRRNTLSPNSLQKIACLNSWI